MRPRRHLARWASRPGGAAVIRASAAMIRFGIVTVLLFAAVLLATPARAEGNAQSGDAPPGSAAPGNAPPGNSQPGNSQPGNVASGTAPPAAAPPDTGAGHDVTVATWGGDLGDAERQAWFEPFTAATGTRVHPVLRERGIGALRARADQGGDPGRTDPWDLVAVRGDEALIGCAENLFEKVDFSRLGGRDHVTPIGDCAVGAYTYAIVLAWDRDKFPVTPSWSDFWDVAKYPGKRGLLRGPRTNLEIALLADGVAPGDVYSTLRTDDGVERAFRKLDQLKPYIVWWQSPAQAAKILDSGEVLLTSAPNGRIAIANREPGRHFGMQWTNSLTAIAGWAIMRSAAHADQGYQLLGYMQDPARQAHFETLIPYAGLAKGANDNLPPDVLDASPANPAHSKTALQVDDQFWRDNLDKLNQRFNAWLAH
jgi:putative spermidine/putrescine transport system substrate-binding protein